MSIGFLASAALGAAVAGQGAGPVALAPLLPEGAFLTQAQGRIDRNEDLGVWEFVLRDRIRGVDGRRLILLPSKITTQLLEMRRMLWEDSVFELTGEITAGPEHNFLIPAFAAPVQISVVEVIAPPAVVPPNDAPPPAVEAAPRNPETIAAELEAALLAQAGTVPVSTDLAPASPPPADPFQPQSLPVVEQAPSTAAVLPDPTMHASTSRLFDRRATISRDERTGSWSVVLHAPPAGVGANLELLPCRQTRALASIFTASTINADVLVSGEITHADGRSYLLPRRIRPIGSDRAIIP